MFVEPPASAEQLRVTIRRAAQSRVLKYVVLIGDEAVPEREAPAQRGKIKSQQPVVTSERAARTTVPTNYMAAKVNIHWGSESEIASDTPYADIDGDGLPDLAVGRIPAHSAKELAAVVRKVIRYEQHADHGPWEKCLNIVSGAGGFGAVTDALVEAAGRQVIQQTVPPEYDVRHICAGATSLDDPVHADFGTRARRQLNEGGLAWIYLGHGVPTELDRIPTRNGRQSILSTHDVPRLHCGPHNPLAVLIACYTGAMDAPQDCLAEDLILAEQGPVAVIAATRVTMPYGNMVMGYELLRACFRDRSPVLGDIFRLSQQRTLANDADDPLRTSLDAIALTLSPSPVDLAAERREHVLMYHLLGDPLTRLRLMPASLAQARPTGTIVK